jgi:ribosome recycling factor
MQHPSLALFSEHTKLALTALHDEFRKLQTGRANASLVEHVKVDAYGQMMELKGVASIGVQDASTIIIQPWDRAVLGAVEKALQQANVGANPVNDGVVIRLTLPPMTEERRKEFTKIVAKLSEDAKIRVRKARHDAQETIKSIDDEDDRERALKELQKLTDDANASIDESAKKKDSEVMSV